MLRYSLSTNSDINLADLQIALISYIISQQQKTNFLITINDLEQSDKNSTLSQENLDILKKLAINTEQRVYRKDNISIYQRFATKLLESKNAYLCFCNSNSCQNNCHQLSKSQIESKLNNKEPYSIILKESKDNIAFNDILNGNITINGIKEFAILKDNKPTLIFADAIDNMISGISFVIKDKSLSNNTLKEIYIHKLLGYINELNYIHVECIKNAPSLKSLLLYGIIPDAIINYSINLIYNKPDEIFYLPNAIEFLNVNKIKSSKEFNLKELQKLNKKHLEKIDSKRLSSIVGFADSDIGEILKLFLKDFSTINELENEFKKIFSPKKCSKEHKNLSKIIANAPFFENFSNFKEYLLKNSGYNNEDKLIKLLCDLIGIKDEEILKSAYPYLKSYILEVVKCQ